MCVPLGVDRAEEQGLPPTGGPDGCGRCLVLEAKLERMTAIARDQARALAELTEEQPPWAPSVAIVYWKYSDVRRADKSWQQIWNRLAPLVSGLGDLPAAQLTPVVWARHRAQRAATPTVRGKPPHDHTLNIEMWRAKEMLDFAVDGGMLKFNPLKSAKATPTVSRRETALSTEAVDLMLAAADDVVDRRYAEGNDDGFRAKATRAFILCLFDSMLRFEEARGLRRDRIGKGGEVMLSARQTKSGRSRDIVLTPRTLAAIAELPADPRSPYVFVHAAEGGRISNAALRDWFTRCCEIAGVNSLAAPGDGDHIVPHMLRASGATVADENGVRATALRDAMGHARISTTEWYMRSAKIENARHVAAVMVEATSRRPPKKVGKTQRAKKLSFGS
jgi:integrase